MLFQKNIVKKYIGLLDEKLVTKAWEQYSSYFLNEDIQTNIHKIKEEQFQEGFLRELFVKGRDIRDRRVSFPPVDYVLD